MKVISSLAADVKLPKMYNVYQQFDDRCLNQSDIAERIERGFSREAIQTQIRPGMKIAVACGSRGICNIDWIILKVVQRLRQAGAKPFIVPAMGSHGGATAQGQLDILAGYHITEETMGCPIVSAMDVKQIGRTKDQLPVVIDQNAAEADGIVVVNRIKPHTGFRGKYESGLMKMMVIGLGKQRGAEICHSFGLGKMAENIETIGKAILANAPVLFGVGLVENAKDQTWKVSVMTPDEIIREEPMLLDEAKQKMPSLPFPQVDVLIVDRIGKNISGDGMDPNITGTFCSPFAGGGIRTERVVVLDLTEETHGCALGMGMADFTTRRFYNKINFDATYPNAVTSRMPIQVKVPMVLDNDREAIQMALKTCCHVDRANPRVIRIRDTLHLENFWISEALAEDAQANETLRKVGSPAPFCFDENGSLF